MFCIPVLAANTGEAILKMAEAGPLADIFEIRLDMMETFDLLPIIRSSPKPVLVTYRSTKECGKGSDDPETRVNHALAAVQAGADFVDVERSLPAKWREKLFGSKGKTGIVLSTHITDGTPSRERLEEIFIDSLATGAEIVKIVTLARRWEDNIRVLDLIPRARAEGVRISVFCMGPMGSISRILAHRMGSCLTFTSLEAGQESAAGQIPVREMKRMLEMLG